MAYSIRFTGTGKDSTEHLSIEPQWWVISELEDKVHLNWVTTNETGSYTDQDADISVGDARIVHDQFRHRLLKDIIFNTYSLASCEARTENYSQAMVDDYKKYVSERKSSLQVMDSAVANASDEFFRFHICVFEWDSGY